MWGKKQNPLRKFLTREDLMAEGFIIYVKSQYPKLFFWHTPNEGRRTAFQRLVWSITGSKAGVSDYIIISPVPEHKGLVLELKVPPNKLTPDQRVFLDEMKKLGWEAEVAFDGETARMYVDNFMKKCRYEEIFRAGSSVAEQIHRRKT